jgi:nucleoside-diphosphate-sugar epimerase
MMRNLMDPLLERATSLRHVSVLQGTKAYGAHVHPIAVPAREDRPRDRHDNFYWLQEDYIRGKQARGPWNFTIWRPQIVFGGAVGVAMNLIPILGAYAAICRELGLPFYCPGENGAVMEAVDTDLIAGALAWAAQSPAASNQTFNITNGDVYVWENVWPAIAKALGHEPAFGHPVRLSEFLPEHAAVWDRIVAKHGLKPMPMAELVGQSHYYADLLFWWGVQRTIPPILVSTVKLRQAGFSDCIDTESMFRKWFAKLAERRVLPMP